MFSQKCSLSKVIPFCHFILPVHHCFNNPCLVSDRHKEGTNISLSMSTPTERIKTDRRKQTPRWILISPSERPRTLVSELSTMGSDSFNWKERKRARKVTVKSSARRLLERSGSKQIQCLIFYSPSLLSSLPWELSLFLALSFILSISQSIEI